MNLQIFHIVCSMNKEEQYQLIIKEFQVKLHKRYLKINILYPALDNTFVFLGMHSIGKDILVHCDKNGAIIYQYKFLNPVDSLGMVDLGKAIVIQSRINQVHIFNLATHQKCELNFNFIFQQSDQSDIITFSQTKLICIVQKGRYNDNRFRLTYYTSNINPDSQPLSVYESDNQWNYQYLIKKGNENSMVIWHKVRQDDQFQFKEFHLEGVNPKFNFYSCPNTIGQPYGKDKFQIALVSIWQKSKNEFCLVCLTEKSNYNHQNSEGVNNNFIWNILQNKIRQTKFTFNPLYSELLIDIYSFGTFSVFHTYSFHNGAAEPSPIYYVNNKKQEVTLFEREWVCTYLNKLAFPSYQKSLYVQNTYENGEVQKFKMKIIQIIEKIN